MTRQEIRTGCIQKIVRVPLMPPPESNECYARDFQGYGILRDANGRDVFFVGSAVSDGNFASLETGTEVTYIMEPGPLVQAAEVRIYPSNQEQCKCQTQAKKP